jgi:predicted TIM-barrel fold metal-dependent hydrolase
MTTFFDANCVLGRIARPQPVMLTNADDVLAELRRHQVTDVLATHAHAVERDIAGGNAAMLELAADRPSVHPAWVLPQHTVLDIPDPEAYVDRMVSSGVRAARVAPSPYGGYHVAEWALGPVWAELEHRHVPVLLAGSDLGRYPDGPALGFSASNIYDICQRHPELPVVILRLNFSALRLIVGLMAECPNLYVETSYFTAHRGLEVVVGRLGADRLIFGSGMPWGPPGPGIVSLMYAGLTEEQCDAIAGENLRRLLAGVK